MRLGCSAPCWRLRAPADRQRSGLGLGVGDSVSKGYNVTLEEVTPIYPLAMVSEAPSTCLAQNGS